MTITIDIKKDLLSEAKKISGVHTEADAVNLALQEYLDRHARETVIGLFGTMDFDPDYDYKSERNR